MRTRDILAMARQDGAEVGRNKASWAWDGNTDDATIRAWVVGNAEGDPMVMDAYCPPSLSGEWADDATPASLCEDYDVSPDDARADWITDEICTAWEDAASTAYYRELYRMACARLGKAAVRKLQQKALSA